MSSSSHSDNDLDTTNSARGLWLVKIPKFMDDKWKENHGDVGKLRINKVAGKQATVNFSPHEHILKDSTMPREHKFNLHSVKEVTIGIFSQTGTGESSDSSTPEGPEKLLMEGTVIQKFECQPIVDRFYINQKRAALLKYSRPNRKAEFIDRPVQVYKPISKHKHNVEIEERKKAEGKKARDDKDKVMEMLFAAFEKHQYYNIKDLQKLTRQPITYLKEILKEVCDYNVKNPHKNMWELKPEYRHYKSDLAEAAADNPGSE